ncbi:protein CutA homolog [Arctopsyche grandis]|uniref:protein CutA homolog n=1 Tax=Arctopsyche grandis TaxID=121162 RepID=UPI00406D80BA
MLCATNVRTPFSLLAATFICRYTAMAEGIHSIAYVTIPNDEVGKTLARKIIENELAACVNIIPKVISIYKWKDEITEDSEALMMIKTRTSRVDDLVKFVRENHPYIVCEVISTPIQNGNPPYLKWISDSVPEIKK